jgi:hypothetical protein
MKTIIVVMLASILSVYAITDTVLIHPEKYCAKMKDGKKVVMHEGKPITKEVVLTNGTRILVNGTIIRSDNTKDTLKVGECISKDGDIALEMKKAKKTK